jgi:hypothetical protein
MERQGNPAVNLFGTVVLQLLPQHSFLFLYPLQLRTKNQQGAD